MIATGFKFFDRLLAQHARKASAATGYFGGASAQTSKSSNTTFALGDHKYDSNSASPHPPYLETEMTQITKLDTPTFQDLTPVDAHNGRWGFIPWVVSSLAFALEWRWVKSS